MAYTTELCLCFLKLTLSKSFVDLNMIAVIPVFMLLWQQSTSSTLLVDKDRCSVGQHHTLYVDYNTLNSPVMSSCKPARSFIQCAARCDRNGGCRGVVYHNKNCCRVSDGTALKESAEPKQDDLNQAKVLLYEDTIINVSIESLLIHHCYSRDLYAWQKFAQQWQMLKWKWFELWNPFSIWLSGCTKLQGMWNK